MSAPRAGRDMPQGLVWEARDGNRAEAMSDYQSAADAREVRGKIKWFRADKGYGFVTPADGSSDVFLHISALKDAGLQDAPEGSTIHCEVGQGRKGIQVLRIIALDTSTATERPPRRPHMPPRMPER